MSRCITALLCSLMLAACTTREIVEEKPTNPLSQEPGQELAGFTANPLLPGGGGLGADTMRVTTEEELKNLTVTVPDLVGYSTSEAEKILEELGFSYQFKGEGTTVTAQLPAAGTKVLQNGASLVLTCGEAQKSTEP